MLRMTDSLMTVILSVSEESPGRVVYRRVNTQNEKAEMQEKILHFGFL